MSISHTPGPWEVHNNSDWSVDTDSSNCFTHIGPRGDDPVAIAVVDHAFALDDILDANARLIAAAPELLAVAMGWEGLHAEMVAAGCDRAELADEHVERFAAAKLRLMHESRAAISKATSRQPEGER